MWECWRHTKVFQLKKKKKKKISNNFEVKIFIGVLDSAWKIIQIKTNILVQETFAREKFTYKPLCRDYDCANVV